MLLLLMADDDDVVDAHPRQHAVGFNIERHADVVIVRM
jgi:hypothetical protein